MPRFPSRRDAPRDGRIATGFPGSPAELGCEPAETRRPRPTAHPRPRRPGRVDPVRERPSVSSLWPDLRLLQLIAQGHSHDVQQVGVVRRDGLAEGQQRLHVVDTRMSPQCLRGGPSNEGISRRQILDHQIMKPVSCRSGPFAENPQQMDANHLSCRVLVASRESLCPSSTPCRWSTQRACALGIRPGETRRGAYASRQTPHFPRARQADSPPRFAPPGWDRPGRAASSATVLFVRSTVPGGGGSFASAPR